MRAEMDQLSHDVGNPAMLYSCGYSASCIEDLWHPSDHVTYERLIYEKSNMVELGFQNAGLNIQNGKFTAGSPGTYLVNWSLYATDTYYTHSGDHQSHENIETLMTLRKNGAEISYSEINSQYDQSGRTLYVHLSSGDTLDLRVKSGNCRDITFCVSLAITD